MQNVQAPRWDDIGADKEATAAECVRAAKEFKDFPLYKLPLPTQGKSPSGEVGLTKRLADEIELSEHFAQDAGEKLYCYKDGVYRPDGRSVICQCAQTLLEGWNLSAKWSSFRGSEVTEYIRLRSPRLQERPPLKCLNLKNGLLDLDREKLLGHSPDFLSSIQLPVAYDPGATCPQWEKFVKETFPEDAVEVAFELVGWLMIPDLSLQTAVLLIGSGSNGKSAFLAALTAFLGRPNVCSVPLHKLESDRFAAARLIGKLANACADLPSSHLAGTSVFKAITGGDTLCAEYKFKPSFDFVPFCRLIFSANHPPTSGDSSEAFFRRWLVIPFVRTFEGGQAIPRPELDARLAAPGELSGVLNKAIQALRRMRERRGILESPSMKTAHDEFRQATDPLSVWLDARAVEGSELFVTKKGLLDTYNQDAAKEGRPLLTGNGLSRALHQLRPRVADAQRTVNGKVQWVWVGLGLVSDDKQQLSIP